MNLEEEIDDYAELFSALNDPNRLRIISILGKSDIEMSVSDIAQEFQLDLSVVSRNLEKLRYTKAISARREGKRRLYSLNREFLATKLYGLADYVKGPRKR